MAGGDGQYRTWLELVGEILQQPLGMSSGHEGQLLDLLNQSFNGACSARNRVSPEWENRILALWPRNYVPSEPPGGYDFRQQPLLRWYAFTRQTGPQSFGRVPDALADSSLKQAWEELARPWNVNHQLAIPLQIGGGDYNAYLISRPDREFTEQELALATLLQPILTLLNDGLTAESLARRLGISPRTAGKHLEHIYRKLDVRDRLMAVQRAHELGLITTSPDNSHTVQPKHDPVQSPWS